MCKNYLVECTKEQFDYVADYFNHHIQHIIRFHEHENYREMCCGELNPKQEGLAFCDEVGLTEKQYEEIFNCLNQERRDLIHIID